MSSCFVPQTRFTFKIQPSKLYFSEKVISQVQFSDNVVPPKALHRILFLYFQQSQLLFWRFQDIFWKGHTIPQRETLHLDLLVLSAVHFCYAHQISQSLLDRLFNTNCLL